MTASIRDVAEKANVSVSTVSRALNGYTDVNEETRKRIEKIAKELGYTPNQSAKNLSSKTQKNMALLISGLFFEQNKVDEFVMDVLKGVYSYVNEKNFTIATYAIDSKMQKTKKLEELCREYSLSGVMLMGMRLEDNYLLEANKINIPCVGVDIDLNGNKTATVGTDDEKAFEEITNYVIQQNHRKLVLVVGRTDAKVTKSRWDGFSTALKKNKLFMKNVSQIYCDFQECIAYEKTKTFLKKYGKTKNTAFICMSDLMAVGVCRAIADMGYSVPKDFSVTGFDGLKVLDYIYPQITTVDQNIIKKGYEGIKLLEKIVEGKSNMKDIYVPHRLVIRDSVKKLEL